MFCALSSFQSSPGKAESGCTLSVSYTSFSRVVVSGGPSRDQEGESWVTTCKAKVGHVCPFTCAVEFRRGNHSLPKLVLLYIHAPTPMAGCPSSCPQSLIIKPARKWTDRSMFLSQQPTSSFHLDKPKLGSHLWLLFLPLRHQWHGHLVPLFLFPSRFSNLSTVLILSWL